MKRIAGFGNCHGCPLLKEPMTYVGSAGDLSTCKYVLVGEAPARDEVRKGVPFVGVTGRLFRKLLKRVRIKEDDCYITNAVKCMIPPKLKGKAKQKVLAVAVAHCRPQIMAELLETPKGIPIAAMGRGARDAVLPELSKGGVLASRGWYRWKDTWDMLVTVHPAYVLYNTENAPLFLKDMTRLKRGKQDPIGPFEVVPGWHFFDNPAADEVLPLPEYLCYPLNTLERLQSLVDMMKEIPTEERGFAAFDLETDQIDYTRDRILCMSISLKSGTAFIIPDSLLYQDGKTMVTTGATKEQVQRFLESPVYIAGKACGVPNPEAVKLLNEMFSIPGYRWVGHNSKYDLRFLKGQLGVEAAHVDFDTIVVHYALDERRGGHSLKPLADDYFDTGDYEKGIKRYLSSRGGRFSMIPRRALYQYNAMDAEITRKFAVRFEKDLKRQGLYEQPFLFPLMAAYPMLLEIELHGIFIDWEELERFNEEDIFPELEVLGNRLKEICGHPEFNPRSSVQCIRILYDEFKFPIVEFRQRQAGKKVKKRTSEKGAVAAWEALWRKGKLPVTERAWEFASGLKQWRHVDKMHTTYTKNWRRNRGPDDRVHPTFQLRGTVTGRLSVVDPPVQTIPSKIRDKWAVGIANIHISPPGWKLLYADYSMAELRILAHLAQDKAMITAFEAGEGDFHALAAELAYGPDYNRDQRQDCKRITYGWAYGGNVEEICTQALHFPPAAAHKIAVDWNTTFWAARDWRDRQSGLMRKRGYVESITGRRRRAALITRENRGKLSRIAYNAPIQSAASDLVLISAMRLHERYKDSGYAHVILMIHDSLILEVRDDKTSELKTAMETTMVNVAREYFPTVPHIAEVKMGTRLGDLM